MKRLLPVIVLLALSVAAAAQPKAFGLRFGSGLEISYQHGLGSNAHGTNFLEVDAGVIGYTQYPGYRVSVAYDFTILRVNLLGGDFSMYIGPGITAGMYDKSKFMAGLAAQYGISYDFASIPLSIGIDTRPSICFTAEGAQIPYKELIPMGSVRWRF